MLDAWIIFCLLFAQWTSFKLSRKFNRIFRTGQLLSTFSALFQGLSGTSSLSHCTKHGQPTVSDPFRVDRTRNRSIHRFLPEHPLNAIFAPRTSTHLIVWVLSNPVQRKITFCNQRSFPKLSLNTRNIFQVCTGGLLNVDCRVFARPVSFSHNTLERLFFGSGKKIFFWKTLSGISLLSSPEGFWKGWVTVGGVRWLVLLHWFLRFLVLAVYDENLLLKWFSYTKELFSGNSRLAWWCL